MFILVLAASSIVLGAIYSIWLFNRVAFGTLKVAEFADLNRTEFYILFILSIAMLILGVYSEILTDITSTPIKQILFLSELKK
jgi:NADH-quinone oxidoreductase subunit M